MNKDNNDRKIIEWTVKNRIFILISILLSTIAGVIFSFAIQPKYQRELSVMILSDIYGNSQINELVTFSYWDINKTGIDIFNEIEVFRSPLLMEKVVGKLNLNITYTKSDIVKSVELYEKTPIAVEFVKPLSNHIGENITSISFDIEIANKQKCLVKNIKLNDESFPGKFETKIDEITETPVGNIIISPTKYFSEYENSEINITYKPTGITVCNLCRKLIAKLQNPKSTVINLSITDTNPKRAEDILNTLLIVYNEEWIRYIKESCDNTSKFIESQLNRLEADLCQNRGFSNLNDNRAGFLHKDTNLEAIFEVNNQLLTAKLTKDFINQQKDKNELIPTNLGLKHDSINSLINKHNQLILISEQTADPNKGKTEPKRDYNNKLTELREAILNSIDNLIKTLGNQVKTFEEKEDEIAKRFSSDSMEIIELISIERKEQIKEAFYNYLLNKLEENELTSSIVLKNTRLLNPATGDDEPISPKKCYIILLSFIFGIAFPYGYKYISEIFARL